MMATWWNGNGLCALAIAMARNPVKRLEAFGNRSCAATSGRQGRLRMNTRRGSPQVNIMAIICTRPASSTPRKTGDLAGFRCPASSGPDSAFLLTPFLGLEGCITMHAAEPGTGLF